MSGGVNMASDDSAARGSSTSPNQAATRERRMPFELVDFGQIKTLPDLEKPLYEAVQHRKEGACLAALERIVQLCQADTAMKIDEKFKAPLLEPVVEVMGWAKKNLVLICIGCCAITCLAKSAKPYPRTIWDASDRCKCVPALVSAMGSLGTFDSVARDALKNVTKNNKQAIAQAVKLGADFLQAEPPNKAAAAPSAGARSPAKNKRG
jgi:hypothetical protein